MNQQDFIFTKKQAMPDALCDELVERFTGHPGVHQGLTGSGLSSKMKRSHDLTMDNFDDLRNVQGRVCDLTLQYFADYFIQYPFVGGLNPVLRNRATGHEVTVTQENVRQLERDTMQMLIMHSFRIGTINIQRYESGIGGYPHWHSEIFPEGSCEALHRIVFFLYFLNDVEKGGETEFLFQKMKVQPRKGTLVIAPAGFTHTHRGNTPESGDKYILTSWLLFKRTPTEG